jgi:hypothetical protein
MKLRIQGSSIRVRLTQSEVRRIADGGRVEQITALSSLAKLCSRVECSPHVQRPVAIFEDQCVTLQLPSMEARQWAESEQIGIEAEQPIGDGTSLRLLVEKDFDCLHPSAEATSDAFPNPKRTAENSNRP